MSLLDRVQKQQGPDPVAIPEGAYQPQAGSAPSRTTTAPSGSRTGSRPA